ncbi:zinc finger BED domain-containing protein 5-like [Aphis gossypii]|uniref:zinc finger BED domain-containing protein 5-like n=1 Tax=Aphis gossypii TaxID=80765 RepID=UPI00215987B7|nr:zinc finger BED domain-containing protein 5-like [Aphis gossypii]
MDFLKENELQLTTNIKKIVIEHLENLEKSLSQYFLATNNNVDWIQNPFVNQKKNPAMLSMLEYEQLIEIKSMSYLKQKFEFGSLNEFWIELKDEYPSLVEKAIFTLLPFVTTYRCEAGFSSYACTINKYRNRLKAAPDLRIQISDIKLNFKNIVNQTMKQFHSSH